mmetsp:Transcript_27161/g.59787  ORF Transcript_27161/g.59787 Transcript_27161/m.59787 type:complete len:101 (+) Transcript_27161:1009-1311(+)
MMHGLYCSTLYARVCVCIVHVFMDTCVHACKQQYRIMDFELQKGDGKIVWVVFLELSTTTNTLLGFLASTRKTSTRKNHDVSNMRHVNNTILVHGSCTNT